MAIVITKEPQGSILNAYNNSIIEFSVDTGTPTHAIIQISGNSFRVTPNTSGEFWFNLKSAIIALFNINNFSDTIGVPDTTTYLITDNTLYREQDVDITVYLDDDSDVTISKTYKYLKSVVQQIRPIFTDSDLVRVLLPSTDNTRTVTYFEGLPFDISIYSNEARTVTITNLRTSSEVDVDLVKGVNRLFLSNGENDNGGFEEDIPLYLGENNLEIDINGTDKIYLTVHKKHVSCGPYLKWFNQSGGWSYWRMLEPFKENENAKSKDTIQNDFYNIEDSVSATFESGKETEGSIQTFTGLMTHSERILVKELFKSPRVYLYANDPLQPFNVSDWKTVGISDGNKTTKTARQIKHDFSIVIEMPKIYTQTL